MKEIIIGFTYLLFAMTMIYGWIMNIIWIIDQKVFELSGEIIVSIIGIFVMPLGSIMGLFVH